MNDDPDFLANDAAGVFECAEAAHSLGIYTNIAATTAPPIRKGIVSKNKLAKPTPRTLRYYLQMLARELQPKARIVNCQRVLAPTHERVTVWRNRERGTAHYRGLYVCSKLWECPWCASQISEFRRKELTLAMANCSFKAVLVTYTLRHNKADKLPVLLQAMKDAFRKLKSGRPWQAVKQYYGIVGGVRALEITYGPNGWHPHYHELYLVSSGTGKVKLARMEAELRNIWLKSLHDVGRDASWLHGVDLTDTDRGVFDYIAKYGHEPLDMSWTITHELAKAPAKLSSKDGATPAQLLIAYGNGDQGAGDLYLEYASSLAGSHQFQWSPGLRAMLGLNADEPTDEEMAQSDDENEIVLELFRTQWDRIVAAEMRGQLLDKVAMSKSAAEIWDWLYNVVKVPHVTLVNLELFMNGEARDERAN